LEIGDARADSTLTEIKQEGAHRQVAGRARFSYGGGEACSA
jgi:hypothetical protein